MSDPVNSVTVGPDPLEAIQPCGHKFGFTFSIRFNGETSSVCLKCLEELTKPKKAGVKNVST